MDLNLKRAQILPLARNTETGKLEFAAPGALLSALEAMKLPGKVFSGEVDPTSDEAIRRSADLAGMVGLAGTGIPRPANSLGVFGKPPTGQLKHGKSHGANDPFEPFGFRTARNESGFIRPAGVLEREFSVGDNTGTSIVRLLRDKDDPTKLNAVVDFLVDGIDADLGPQGAFDPKQGIKIINQVASDVKSILEAAGVKRVLFASARPELDPLYLMLRKHIARVTDGQEVPTPGNSFLVETGKKFQKSFKKKDPLATAAVKAERKQNIKDLNAAMHDVLKEEQFKNMSEEAKKSALLNVRSFILDFFNDRAEFPKVGPMRALFRRQLSEKSGPGPEQAGGFRNMNFNPDG